MSAVSARARYFERRQFKAQRATQLLTTIRNEWLKVYACRL